MPTWCPRSPPPCYEDMKHLPSTPSLSAPMRPRFFVGDVNFRQNFIGASPMTQFLIGASPMTKFLIGAPPMTKFLIGASPVTIFLIGASPLTLFFNGASPYLQGLKLVQRTASVLNCSYDFLGGGVNHPFCHELCAPRLIPLSLNIMQIHSIN